MPDWSRQLPYRAMQDISEISDLSSELTATPGEPLAGARPPERNLNWIATIGASGTLHAALAAALMIAPATTLSFQDAMQAEGADQSGANVVGSASDGQMPGAVNVALVPTPKPPTTPAVKPAPTPAPQAQRESAAPAPAKETVEKPDPAPDILIAGTPRDNLHSPAQADEQPVTSAIQDESSEPEPAFSGQPPVPTPRPSPADGSGAVSKMADARGTADGQEIKASIASKGKAKAANGEAARSRYSGEIASKLAKANRLVSKSAQAKALNNATVSFVVLANGRVTDLELAKSSGSRELDQFALNLVRQQSPFPPIPPEIGISSWRFRAPIGPY
ncbi:MULTISPECIES: energy transducer TonB [unclassified Mesorhizobium]|uniref:energy transducer TonB family protein n=1 Tax=unclassified Mesorhizobium TaxID=325217 RepID=UPI001FE20B2D|nr:MULTISPECIES: energy transducer TonB [unclassified Mesorhizobium]